jgi:GAF domain-containing protein
VEEFVSVLPGDDGARFDALVGCAPVALVWFDIDGRCIEVNRRFAAEVACALREELLGRPAAEVLARLGPGAEAGMAWLLAGGKPEPACRVTERCDGSADPPRAWWVTWYSAGGPVEAVGAVLTEVDPRGDVAHLAERLAGEQAARLAAEQAQARLGFLAEASRLVGGSLGRREILRRVARLAVPRLADWCSVYMRRETVLERVAMFAADPGRWDVVARFTRSHGYPVDSSTAVARVFRTAVAERLVDPLSRPTGLEDEVLTTLRALDIRETMLVPVVVNGRSEAVIALALEGTTRHFSDEDLAVTTDLAARVAAGMGRALEYEREHGVAVSLTRAVLPAAAAMAQLRNAVRAYIAEGHDPAESLLLAQRMLPLIDAEGDQPIASALVAMVELAQGEPSVLRWANAGHLEPASSPMLGCGPVARPALESVALRAGATLVLFTDGLVEERGVPIDHNMARLCDIVQDAHGAPVELLCDRVLDEMAGQVARADDCCVLVLRRAAPATGGDPWYR